MKSAQWVDFAVTSLDRTQLVSLAAAIRRLRNLVVAPRSIEQQGDAVFPHRPRLDRSASFVYLRQHYPNLVPEAKARVLRYTDFSVTWSIDALIVSLEKFQSDAPIHVLVERVENEVARTAI